MSQPVAPNLKTILFFLPGTKWSTAWYRSASQVLGTTGLDRSVIDLVMEKQEQSMVGFSTPQKKPRSFRLA